jgi:hypothetical protein
MRSKTLSLLLTVSAVSGCASHSSIPSAPVAPESLGERVTINAAAGKYQQYVVEDMNKGQPLQFNVRLTQPRATTQWAPSVILCARGERLSEHSCLWLVVDADQQAIYATPYKGGDPTEASKSVLPYRTRVGANIGVKIQLQPSSFTFAADGTTLLTKSPTFAIKGYSFGCVSAHCSFEFSA